MDFISELLGTIGSLAGEIAQAVLFVLQIVVNVFVFVYDTLIVVANFFLKLMQDIGKFFQHIWDNFFKSIFGKLLQGIGKFGQFLHNIFGPVVRFLRRASQFIDRIYNHYIRQILRWIRIARVFLTVLKALHVKWAGKLDSILGTIQSDIQRAFLTIKGYLNVLIDLANILADPTNLLRRPTTLLSLRRVFNAAIRQFTGLPPGFFVPSPKAGAGVGMGYLPLNFNAENPVHNPPPSFYLAFDGNVPSFEGLADGETIPDDSIDSVGPLDFFTSTAADLDGCDDPESCLDESILLALQGR